MIIKDKPLKINECNNLNYINNNITIIRNNNSEQFENNNEKNNFNNNNIINNINNKNNIFNNTIKSSLNEGNLIKKSNSKKISLINSINNQSIEPFEIIKPYKKHKAIDTYKQSKYLFPFYYYFLDIIFDNLINIKCFSKKYKLIYNFMCRIYDISSHVTLVKQFSILKNLLKEKMNDDKENFIGKLYNKININNNNVLENLGNEFKHNKSINKSLNFNLIS